MFGRRLSRQFSKLISRDSNTQGIKHLTYIWWVQHDRFWEATEGVNVFLYICSTCFGKLQLFSTECYKLKEQETGLESLANFWIQSNFRWGGSQRGVHPLLAWWRFSLSLAWVLLSQTSWITCIKIFASGWVSLGKVKVVKWLFRNDGQPREFFKQVTLTQMCFSQKQFYLYLYNIKVSNLHFY